MNIEDWIRAGRIASKALEYAKNIVKPGVKVKDVLDKIEEFILSFNAELAFPAQISINNFAAHYCSDIDDDLIINESDVVKIDVGVLINGAIGDTAITLDFSHKYENLLRSSEEALKKAIDLIKPGININEISKVIEYTIRSYGYNPIKNLSGHTMKEYALHIEPSIPNVNTNIREKLKHNQVIAIEPFSTDGYGLVKEKGESNVFMQVLDKNVRHPFAREILKEVKKYKKMPFARRWLEKKFGKMKTQIALKELLREKIIVGFPPLVEVNNGIVAQFEHTIIVLDKPIVTTLNSFY